MLVSHFIRILVPGSSGVEDALGDMNPQASPVLRCLLYLVPSDPYLLEILVDDSPPVLTILINKICNCFIIIVFFDIIILASGGSTLPRHC